jgi:hypothetical protein
MFSHLHRAEWWPAAAWGVFVSATRPNGFFLALPAGIFMLQQLIAQRRILWTAVAAAVSPLIGMLAYSVFLYAKFGDPLAWLKGQTAWRRVFVGVGPALYTLIFERFNVIAEHGWYHYTSNNPYDFMHSIAAIVALAAIWPCTRRFGLPYGAFVTINIVPPLLMGGTMSIGRMSSVLFPVFLWIGAVLPPQYLSGWIAASSVLQGLIAVLFFTWRPVF